MELCVTLLLALLGASSQALLSAVDPAYPPNTRGGWTAVFVVNYDSGTVKEVVPLSGQDPFSASGRQALSHWRFDSNASGKTLVAICFRRPEFFAVGSAVQKVSTSVSQPGLPVPETVVEPTYPPNTTTQGSVVLRIEVAKDGSIAQIDVVKGLGVLTKASIQAVRKWRFMPAQDQRGKLIASEAYAVFVFRSPLLAPTVVHPR